MSDVTMADEVEVMAAEDKIAAAMPVEAGPAPAVDGVVDLGDVVPRGFNEVLLEYLEAVHRPDNAGGDALLVELRKAL